MIMIINEQEIHEICKRYLISKYTINPDGSIDVNGDVSIATGRLEKLPLKFNKVSGDFYCSWRNLTTLEGCPKEVGDDFYCSYNKLKTLEHSQLIIGGHFYCTYFKMSEEEIHLICGKYNIQNYSINPNGSIDVKENVILVKKNLKEIPLKFNKVYGFFDISNNRLTSLEGSPREVDGYFDCSDNLLTSLIGSPDKVHYHFYCAYNKLTSLENSPNEVGGHFYCSHNNLKNLIGLPSKIFGPVRCGHNPLESLEGFELDYYKLTCSNKENLIKKHKRSKKLKLIESL